MNETKATLDLGRAGFGDRGDTITVKVTPFVGSVRGAVSRVSVKVQNTAPVARDESARTRAGVPVEIVLRASDEDGDTLKFALLARPLGGTATIIESRNGVFILRYTPRANWSGREAIPIRVFDSSRAFDDATISIAVSPTRSTTPSGGLALAPRKQPFA